VPKFAFSMPYVEVVVDAADAEEAYDRVEMLLPVSGSSSIPDSRDLYWFEVRHVAQRPEPLKACVVCGCTDLASCDEGCSWLTDNLCSTDDEAHAEIAAAQGFISLGF
jgi:hypothetical protein